MELEVNVVELEDGKDYVIVDAIQNNDSKYLFLANKDDLENKCIRKIYLENNEEYLRKLTDEEFEEALELFNLKHKDEGLNE